MRMAVYLSGLSFCLGIEAGEVSKEKAIEPGKSVEREKSPIAGDMWGPEGWEGLQAGIRVVDSGASLEYVLKNNNRECFEIRAPAPWTFCFQSADGKIRTYSPAKQSGMEGLILLRKGETRRGRMGIREIVPDFDATATMRAWVTWGRRESLKSGVVEIKDEGTKTTPEKKKDAVGRSMSSLQKKTPEGTREASGYKHLESKLVVEKASENLPVTWSVPAEEGVRCGVLVNPAGVQKGNAVEVDLILENVGSRDVAWWKRPGLGQDWVLKLTPPNGIPLERTELGKRLFPPFWVLDGRNEPILLRSGEISRLRIDLDKVFGIEISGAYKLSVLGQFLLSQGETLSSPDGTPGAECTVDIELTVKRQSE